MKVIFLDIDGVLNGYLPFTWFIFRLFHNKSEKINSLRRKYFKPYGIHEDKVKRLAKIVNSTGAKVVLSSSWRYNYWDKPYNELNSNGKLFRDLINKYNINIIDRTPFNLLHGNRCNEICQWLSTHENEIESFVILDDNDKDMNIFIHDDRFIHTVIKFGKNNYALGLRNKHVKQAIKALNIKLQSHYF